MSHISVFEDDLREQNEKDRRKARRKSWMTPAPEASDSGGRNTVRNKRRRSEEGTETPPNRVNPATTAVGVTPSLFPFFNGGFKTPRCRFQGQTDAAGAARRIQFQPDLEAGIQLEEDATDRERERALCDRVWHVHRLSPLFGIGSAPREPDDPAAATDSESDDFNREKVVGAFKAELQRTLEEQHRGILDQAGTAQETTDRRLEVVVDGKPGIRGTQHDAVGMMVEVKRGPKSVFTAHMLSVDCQEELNLEDIDRYSILPVLLTSTATGPIAKAVLGLVERFFDAVIGKISVSQIDLKWMLAAWVRLGPEVEEKRPAEEEEKEEAEAPEAEVEEGRRQNYGRVVATYEVPVTKGLQTTTVTLKQEQLIKLWKSIHDTRETFATDMEVKVFHSALSKFIGNKFGIQCSRLRLSSIQLPIVSVDHAGRIKIHNSKHVHTVLRFFTDMCQLKLESAAPGIARSTNSD